MFHQNNKLSFKLSNAGMMGGVWIRVFLTLQKLVCYLVQSLL